MIHVSEQKHDKLLVQSSTLLKHDWFKPILRKDSRWMKTTAAFLGDAGASIPIHNFYLEPMHCESKRKHRWHPVGLTTTPQRPVTMNLMLDYEHNDVSSDILDDDRRYCQALYASDYANGFIKGRYSGELNSISYSIAAHMLLFCLLEGQSIDLSAVSSHESTGHNCRKRRLRRVLCSPSRRRRSSAEHLQRDSKYRYRREEPTHLPRHSGDQTTVGASFQRDSEATRRRTLLLR